MLTQVRHIPRESTKARAWYKDFHLPPILRRNVSEVLNQSFYHRSVADVPFSLALSISGKSA